MNSLLLGLALTSSPSAAAHPPAPYPPPAAHAASYQSYQRRTETSYQSYQSRYTPYPPPPPYQPAAYQPPAPAYPPPAPVPPVAPAFYPPAAPVPPAPAGHGHHGPMTLEEFAHCFKPTCGVHHLTLIHPVTCRPVHVCLKLPHGETPRVCVHRRSIEFDYRHHDDIEIEFNRNGTVSIDYDD